MYYNIQHSSLQSNCNVFICDNYFCNTLALYRMPFTSEKECQEPQTVPTDCSPFMADYSQVCLQECMYIDI